MKKNTIPKMLSGFARGLKRFFIVAIITSAVTSLLGFVTPLIVGFAVDTVIGDKASELPAFLMRLFESLTRESAIGAKLVVCAAFVVTTAILSAVFNYTSRVNMSKGSERMINKLRSTLFQHTQYLPFEWHTQHQTGDIIQRCTSDVETIRR